MFESIAKNFWILVTIMIPGMFTYGMWRLLLILHPSTNIKSEVLVQLDELSVLTWSVIIAIALLQQSIGLIVESFLCFIAKLTKTHFKRFYLLFYKRFELANMGLITNYASSVIGNLFLSINIFIGLLFLLAYFLLFEKLTVNHWIIYFILIFLASTFINVIFRIKTSLKVIK